MSIDTVRDTEGVRIALEEIFEGDYVRFRLSREGQGADSQTRERMRWQIPKRTLSPGYYAFAEHLLLLEDQRKAGIGFDARGLAAFEAAGLVALGRARAAFEAAHPACSSCGTRQENRFGSECVGCGIKFQRKKRK